MPDSLPSSCVDADTASAYAEHRLSDEERLTIDAHIDGCSSCRELISMVAKLGWSQTATGQGQVRGVGEVLPRGTRVGPFEIDKPLDAGGMGLVYAAHDARLQRRVALKCVREQRGSSDQLLEEAKMMAQLSHPNVVPVFDVIEAHGQIFIAMELVVGSSVRQWLAAKPRTWKQVVDVFIAAGAGLAAAHAARIVHGDVKPANILFGDDGRVRVTDFGLARFGSAVTPDAPGPQGTPAYMSPEQRAGKACDVRGDQYSFCASLQEALREANAPRALRRILARGLSVDPADRFPSMSALLIPLKATRSSRWLLIGIAAAVTLASAALAYDTGGRRVETTMCSAAAPKLTNPWNPESRALVRRSFQSTKLVYVPQTLERIEANLDAWTGSFEAARKNACESGWFDDATPLENFSAQLGCLQDRAREVRAVVSQFRDADATVVLNAIAATEQLTPVSACAAAAPAQGVTPDSPEILALRDELARAHVLVDSGKFREALPLSTKLAQDAEALKDPGMLAAALVSLGINQARVADYEKANATLMRGLRLAETAQDDRTRAQAWVSLVQIEYWRGRYEQAVFLESPALGAAERAGDIWIKTEILLMLGGSLSQLGRAEKAQPMFEEAVALRRKLYGEKDRRLAFALSSLGNAYSMSGDLARGTVAHRQAMEAGEAALGASHPNVGILHNNLGDDYLYGLEPALAIAELEKGVAIIEAVNGPAHRDVAVGLTSLGFAQRDAGEKEKAAKTFERAEEIWRTQYPQHPVRAQALLGKYLTSASPSIADLETALPLSQRLPPFEKARIQLALGMATPGAKGAALVKSAIEGLSTSTLPLIQRELAVAKAWQR